MTVITEIKHGDDLAGFEVSGHSGYRNSDDVICAGVSVLTANTINSLSAIAKVDDKDLDYTYLSGYARYEVRGKPSGDAELLLQSAKLGYMDLAERYQNYVTYQN